MKRALVLGLGKSGKAVVRFLLLNGITVFGVDQNRELLNADPVIASLRLQGLKTFHEDEYPDLYNIDCLIVSPGISTAHPIYQKALEIGLEVIGEIELACRFINGDEKLSPESESPLLSSDGNFSQISCAKTDKSICQEVEFLPTPANFYKVNFTPCLNNQKFLGITGTNGKTTVTLLVAHVLNACGFKAKALGNIGAPLIEEVLEMYQKPYQDSQKVHSLPNVQSENLLSSTGQMHDEIKVIELSSFQLDTLHSKVMDAAVILNITPDHLDRYPHMDDYAGSKFHINECLKSSGKLFVEEKCWRDYHHLVLDCNPYVYGYSPDCEIFAHNDCVYKDNAKAFSLPEALHNKCSHDVENLMAAYALCGHVGVSGEQFQQALKSFNKPPHRIEYVRTLNGVKYYNDSKGTNIDAVIKAVLSLKKPIILIVGGVDKGTPYTAWIDAFIKRVKCIFAIGEAAFKIKQDLKDHLDVKVLSSLEEAVQQASKAAQDGDTVLLSPGCSSYDMFRDYAHRGDEFKKNVYKL